MFIVKGKFLCNFPPNILYLDENTIIQKYFSKTYSSYSANENSRWNLSSSYQNFVNSYDGLFAIQNDIMITKILDMKYTPYVTSLTIYFIQEGRIW